MRMPEPVELVQAEAEWPGAARRDYAEIVAPSSEASHIGTQDRDVAYVAAEE